MIAIAAGVIYRRSELASIGKAAREAVETANRERERVTGGDESKLPLEITSVEVSWLPGTHATALVHGVVWSQPWGTTEEAAALLRQNEEPAAWRLELTRYEAGWKADRIEPVTVPSLRGR